MNMHVPTIQRSLSDVVAEYDAKAAAIAEAMRVFEQAASDLKMAVTVGGTFGQTQIDTGHVYASTLSSCLLKSAWLHIYAGCNIKVLSSPREQKLFEQAIEKPAPFTLDNISATFGRFLLNPRASMLRALAEVFCDLDPAYKSHDKVKFGVAGLPKRVVLRGFGNYSTHGRDQIMTILNALAAYQGKPLVSWREINALTEHDISLEVSGDLPVDRTWSEPESHPGRGIRLRQFKNGNGHLFFNDQTLLDINRALAEFYGNVLPDTTDEKPAAPRPGTEVSKDLQFYGTPAKVIRDVLADMRSVKGKLFLEPSCGDGRMLDELRAEGARVFGIEVDHGRAAEARRRGHSVHRANFLDCVPEPVCDGVLMNPPFYGKHYAKHVRHALKYLLPGGVLVAILPVTARYDHGLLDDLGGHWRDLPIGSFSESGTNINTTVWTYYAPKA